MRRRVAVGPRIAATVSSGEPFRCTQGQAAVDQEQTIEKIRMPVGEHHRHEAAHRMADDDGRRPEGLGDHEGEVIGVTGHAGGTVRRAAASAAQVGCDHPDPGQPVDGVRPHAVGRGHTVNGEDLSAHGSGRFPHPDSESAPGTATSRAR